MGYRTERIFVLATIQVIGLGLILAVSRGASGAAPTYNAGLLWAMTFAMIIVAAGGSVWLRSALHVASATRPVGRSPSTPAGSPGNAQRLSLPFEAVVPALLVGGFTLFIQFFDSGFAQTLILVVAALAFAAVYWAQVHSVELTDRFFGLAQAVLNLISHLCAFLLFATIYGLKTRSLFSATSVAVITALLVYELLLRDASWHKAMGLPVESRRSTTALLSIVCGLVLGELTWGLNYWAALTTLIGGAFLLVAFYVAYGLVSHYVDRNLTRQTLLEFTLVGAVATIAVFASAFIVG